jgi:cell division septation protein DedD
VKRASGRQKQAADATPPPEPPPSRNKPDRPALAKSQPDNTKAAEASKPEAAESIEGWKVQLGAYTSKQAARTAWATLVSQSASLLKGQDPVYAPKGEMVRLQVGPFDARGDAAALCTKLAAAGRPCFVTR